MIVVMPAGHTRRGPAAPGAIARTATDEFAKDFVADVMPYVEKNYRVLTDRNNTAIAGLSMGGNQALQVGVPNLERFGYIGVYSSGLLGAFPQLGGRRGAPPAPAAPAAAPPAAAPAAAPAAPAAPQAPTAAEWEKEHAATLDNAALKKGLKVFWFATGKDDFLLSTTQRDRRALQEARLQPGDEGIVRRPHVDQLARLPERVRADAVPVGSFRLKAEATDEMFVPHGHSGAGCRCIGSACGRGERAKRVEPRERGCPPPLVAEIAGDQLRRGLAVARMD